MKRKYTKNILVTGSSGYVASDLIPRLKEGQNVWGLDLIPSLNTDFEADIGDKQNLLFLERLELGQLIVVNLAAARFDFGATANDYFKLNVECHEKFLKSLAGQNIKKFIHVSSVASFDGYNIPYSEELKCDDAYRSTKYLQEELIQNWCRDLGIELTIIYPSAIFSRDHRSDTNIGKLQSISKFLPFIPSIDVVKSLTFLPNLSKFIIDSVVGDIPAGKYLTIEKPSLTVSRMIQVISGRSIKLFHIAFFPVILKIIANFLYALGFFGKVDMKLTPNRVVKLFSDTSYSHVNFEDVDTETYASRNCEQLPEILAKFTKG